MKKYLNFVFLLLSVTLLSCKKDKTELSQEQVISLDAESPITGLTADGKTIITFRATIPVNAVEEAKHVTFTITQGFGAFQGTVIDAKNTVKADADGIARSSVKLGATSGTFYISASVTRGGVVYRSKDLAVTLGKAEPYVLEVAADNVQPEADGFTLISLSASTNDPNEKTVELSTNLGTFTQSPNDLKIQLSFNASGKANTILKVSNQALPHIISFSSGLGKTALLQIHPSVSRPDLLLVEPNTLLVNTEGGNVQLKCYLRKSISDKKVSVGYPVSFRAYQLVAGNQVNVGRFTETANANATANGSIPVVNFFADTGDIDISKEIVIDCSTYKSATELIHVLTVIRIKK